GERGVEGGRAGEFTAWRPVGQEEDLALVYTKSGVWFIERGSGLRTQLMEEEIWVDSDREKSIEQALRDGDEERVIEALAEEFAPGLDGMIEEARRRLVREEGGDSADNVVPLRRHGKGENR
ncbi:MAG: hypothetical protein M3Q60_18280, partial [Actinomycetota bacterium]|nr:hypothetical protein [Actinomycetota bacterium]